MKLSNKRRTRTAMFSVNVADKYWSNKQTIFTDKPKLTKNISMEISLKEFKPIALEINQFESRHTNNIN